MKNIEPLLSVVASLFDSYKTQVSLITMLDTGGFRTFCISSLKDKIAKDIKVLRLLHDTLLSDIQTDMDKRFETVCMVSEAVKDTDKTTLRELSELLARETVDKEARLEARFLAIERFLLVLLNDLEKV